MSRSRSFASNGSGSGAGLGVGDGDGRELRSLGAVVARSAEPAGVPHFAAAVDSNGEPGSNRSETSTRPMRTTAMTISLPGEASADPEARRCRAIRASRRAAAP